VLGGDAVILAGLLLLALPLSSLLGFRDGGQFTKPGWWQGSAGDIASMLIALGVLTGAYAWLHFRVRELAAGHVKNRIEKHYAPGPDRECMGQAFSVNTRAWHSIFGTRPVGWSSRTRKRLQQSIAQANEYVQTLNDTFTDPSGPGSSQHPATCCRRTHQPGRATRIHP